MKIDEKKMSMVQNEHPYGQDPLRSATNDTTIQALMAKSATLTLKTKIFPTVCILKSCQIACITMQSLSNFAEIILKRVTD